MEEYIMKKIFVLLLVVMNMLPLLWACTKNDGNDISYETGTYRNKNWEETLYTYAGDAIPDKETAVAVTTAIYNSMKKSQRAQDWVPQYVFYDEPDEIWIVSFWPDSDEPRLGDCWTKKRTLFQTTKREVQPEPPLRTGPDAV